MIIEAPATFEEYAALDAENRGPLDLPTREEVENGKPAFCVSDEASACWVLRKMASVEAEADRVKAQAAARLAELSADARALHARFDEPLRVWAEGEATRRRRKTVTLLDGSLCFRSVPARFTVADGQAAFDYAQSHAPGCIVETVTTHLDTKAYIARAEATGEALPGLEHQPAREAFKVDTKGKEATAHP